MPRVAGQIDLAKSEAILDAAGEILASRGLGAPMEEIARLAGVSKQTIYNRFGSKAELVRALVERRVDEITAPLDVQGTTDGPEAALTGFAKVMMMSVLTPRSTDFMRLYMQGAVEMPDLAQAVFEAGPKSSRARLAVFLEREAADGRLEIDDPALAAEFFAGMVVGSHQTALLLGVDLGLNEADIDHIAQEATRRFIKAYSS